MKKIRMDKHTAVCAESVAIIHEIAAETNRYFTQANPATEKKILKLIRQEDLIHEVLKKGGKIQIAGQKTTLRPLSDEFMKERTEAESAWNAYKNDLSVYLDKPDRTKAELNNLNSKTDRLNRTHTKLKNRIFAYDQERFDRFSIMIWFMLALNIFLIVLGLLNIHRKLLIPLKKILPYFINISNGQVGFRIETERNDEIGKLIAAFNKMNQKLQQTVGEIKKGAESIVQGSEHISKGSQTLSQGAGAQAASAEEVASSVEEMTATIEINTNNAVETEIKSKEAVKAMHMIMRAGNKSVDAINDITEKVKVINDIAFQTNLLSLNASIEAKKAGEMGKGFSAVANQVRKLADKSKKAADEISLLSDSSKDTILKTNDIIKRMSPEIEKTSVLAKQVAGSAKEQRQGANQINQALQQMNEVTQKSAAISEQLASEAEEFASVAETLKTTVSYFDTEDKGQVNLNKKNLNDNLLEWSEKYAIGLNEIDAEHKKLIGLINKLYKSYGNSSGKRHTRKVIKDLLAYTEYHFATEEKYFEEFNYADKDRHIRQHKIFISKVKDFQTQFKADEDTTLGFDIIEFLMNWFLSHILKADAKYVNIFKDHGVK